MPPDFSSQLPVGLTGLNLSSVPTYPVNADSNGNLLVKDYSDGPVTPGAVASASALIGGQYNSTLPTLTNTQQSAIQLDSSGRLIISPLTSSSIVTANQGGSWTVAATQSGTWTTGRTWTLASGTDSISAVQSGIWNIGTLTSITNPVAVTQGTSPWVVTSQNFPTTVDTNYGTVGASTIRAAAQIGNATGAASFGAGATEAQTLRVAANTYDGFGNAITSASNGYAAQQLLSVQVPNTSVAPVALGALNANVSIAMAGLQTVGFQMAAGTFIGTITPQCSIDGGTSWTGCSFLNSFTGNVTTSFTFSSANTLTILGVIPIGGSTNVRVIVTSYTSGTASCILSASEALASTSPPGAAQNTGSISALNGTVVASTAGYAAAFFDITGTWVGTLTFQAQNGDGNWYTILAYSSVTGTYTNSSTTVNGAIQFNCAGYIQSRVIATAWTSGTANIGWSATAYPHQIQIYNPSNAANFLSTSYTSDGAGNAIGSPLDTAGTSLYTIKPDTSATGTLGALNATLNLPINDVSSAYALITGTWVGTIQFQGSVNGTNFVPLEAVQGGPTNAYSTAGFTANGGVRIALPAGFTSIQAVMTAYTSGTATVVINASAAPANVEVVQFNAANLKATANLNDGSGNAIASYNSQLDTADVINTSISSGSITVSTTAVAARVGGTNLANRKMLMISPLTNTVYLGSSSSVTTSNGIPIQPGQVMSFAFSANVNPYLISASSGTVNIFEGA